MIQTWIFVFQYVLNIMFLINNNFNFFSVYVYFSYISKHKNTHLYMTHDGKVMF